MLIITFELIKKIKERKTIILLISFFCLSASFIEVKNNINSKEKKYRLEDISRQVVELEREVESLANEIVINRRLDIDTATLEYQKANLQDLMSLNLKLKNAILFDDWQKEIQLLIDIGKLEDQPKENIIKLEYLLNHDIVPIYEDSSMQGINFLKLYLGEALPLLILFLILLLTVDNFGEEYENGTFKTVLVQPISRRKIWASKMVVNLLLVLSMVVLHIGLLFTYTTIRFGLGNVNYPYFYIDNQFTSIVSFLPIIFLITILQIITLTIFLDFISMISKTTLNTFFNSILFLSLFYLLFIAMGLVIGPIAYINLFEKINDGNSLIVFVINDTVASIVLFLLFDYIFKKRDI